MANRFFICSVAQPGEGYEAENFARCQRFSGHFMHEYTRQKGAFAKVRPGDIAILKYKDRLVAFGRVVSVANDKSCADFGDWNHRIMVDRWIWHNPANHADGVSKYRISLNTEDGSQFATIKQVTTDFGMDRCKEIAPHSALYTQLLQLSKMKDYITLLKANKNIILHGAPGTGKTYLAKQIAKAMDAEVGFVQFHPSYDYTDFVEGLRPVKGDARGDIGFELRSGSFKMFCERALKNLVDSRKDPLQLKAERDIESCYNLLVERIRNGEITYVSMRSDKPLPVDISSQDNILVCPANSTTTYTVSLVRILRIAEIYDSQAKLNSIPNITKAMRDAIGGCNSSGYWAVLNTLYTMMAKQPSPVNSAEKVKERPFVFIIDEINRAEISKVFGELFFSIDPGYRGQDGLVTTQYANLIDEPTAFDIELGTEGRGHFFVPENVYIIGTMNDIDRSVDRMDFAMRRRFAFKEISAADSTAILDGPVAWGGEAMMPERQVIADLKARMSRLNDAIISDNVGLSEAYQCGGAYFLKYALYKDEPNPFDSLWRYHLEPLMREYLRGIDENGSKLNYLKQQYNNA